MMVSYVYKINIIIFLSFFFFFYRNDYFKQDSSS